MPTIAFSNAFMSGSNSTFMGRFINLGGSGSSDTNFGLLPASGGVIGYTQYAGPSGMISIMKGTVPTDFSGLTGYNSRSADILAQWTVRAGEFSSSTGTTNPAIINTSFSAATASGTTTWFWWITRQYDTNTYTNNIYQQIIGTVGEVGSGSDLEIPSTTITSGQLLRILNLRLQLPSTYAY